jgi:hypothetical protein
VERAVEAAAELLSQENRSGIADWTPRSSGCIGFIVEISVAVHPEVGDPDSCR